MDKFANIKINSTIVQFSVKENIVELLIKNQDTERIPEVFVPMHKDTFALMYATMTMFIQSHKIDIMELINKSHGVQMGSSEGVPKEIKFPDWILSINH